MPLPSNPPCNFKIINTPLLPGNETTFPNGYRFATVEEVKNHFDTIKRRFELLQDEKILLLDGCISVPGWRLQHTLPMNSILSRCVVVNEKEWDEDAGIWKKKCSACYSSNGILLRKHVYDGITLSPQGRDGALLFAAIHQQTEVIYWLFKTRNPIEFGDFRNRFSSTTFISFNYGEMVKSMLASKFPLQLPLERDNKGNTTLDYAISLIESCLRYPPYDNILSILAVELFIEVYSVHIVHSKTTDGNSFLDTATQNEWIPVLTKLLSVSPQSLDNHMSKIKHRSADVLIESVERGYQLLVNDLLDLKDDTLQVTKNVCLEVLRGAILKGYPQCLQKLLEELKKQVGNELQQDEQGKTLFHYAAESGNKEFFQKLATAYKDEYRERKKDKCGRNFLHWAALNGQSDICKDYIDQWQSKVDAKDCWGQNSLHYSAKGKYGHQVVDILIRSSSLELIYSRDGKGRTPLHVAAAKANLKMVNQLLSVVADNPSQMKRYIEQPDIFGRTALQMAAGAGHTKIVQLFLDKDCDPLTERDIRGSTALHYATQAKDADAAVAVSRCLLNKYGNSTDKKSLLLWASAAGIGTAEEREDVDPHVKDFLSREKERNKAHLLRAAAKNGNVEMAWDLLKRGANIQHISDTEWRKQLGYEEEKNVDMVLMAVKKQIEIAKEQVRDKPSSEDNLGRNIFAEGLAALFLNKFFESPITVGISGEWGMGKSSLMIQTENILLIAASQLAFPNLLHFENFEGAEKISLNTKGRKIYRKIKNGVGKLLAQGKDKSGLDTLVELLNEYHPQYHAIYKSLACMDLANQTSRSALESQNQPLRGAPRILTIRYNAWHYRDEHEAWAGLAVTISNEIEQAMTRAQKFSTCWKYSWAKNSINICIQIFLPCLLATFLAGWVAWAAWTLLRDAKFKDLKYGSLPCTIIAIVWVVLKSVISVVKPVSTQMMGYITSPDHTSRLGYQQQVISDINFLKGELGKKPHWFFSLISGEWCWNWFGLHPNNVENTCVPKFSPATEEQLRIITFVDDLDRCDEKVILQILSAINLVLAECKINVILGMDKKMIERAVKGNFKDSDDKDLADKFICKIVQIPLSLPDPTDEESNSFLQHQLRCQPHVTTAPAVEDGGDTDYGELDSDNDVPEEGDVGQGSGPESAVVDMNIGGSNQQQKNCHGIIKKVCHWLGHFFQILCVLACNLLSELRKTQDDDERALLATSKGVRLMREMLLSNYSPEEAETIYKLKRFATDHQKLPREWKRLLNYRLLAWIILSMMGKVYKLPGWKVELVAWVFICWQWKHEMNTLIKGWHKYAVPKSKGKGKALEDDDQTQERWHGPSLKEIVKNYVDDELEKSQQTSSTQVDHEKDNNFQCGISERHEGLMKMRECLRQDPFVKAILSMYGHDTTTIEESQTQYLNWLKLQEALEVQDVSMRGIQLFQQFRLHCETDHLPWPLPESNESKI